MINGSIYRDMIISAANNIANHQEDINKLNIFPVPDGDTGTNMGLTMLAGKKAVENFNGSLSDCSDSVAAALLRGGRGNSGVILSLFFRGVSKELKNLKEASTVDVARAFKSGVESAYKAVRKPTEGTVLTVMRFCAEKANEVCTTVSDEKEFFEIIIKQANQTLLETPELLPVLKQANVVDAGGKGFCVILDGMMSVISGNGVILSEDDGSSAENQADFGMFNTEDIKFAYCTECIVDKVKDNMPTSSDVENFKEFVMNSGDSGVFIDDDDFIKFHIHTNDPGKVLSECLKYGVLAKVKIENMKEQHTNLADGASEEKAAESKIKAPEKKYGFVSVAAGEGIKAVFTDLGVDNLVSGGQTMNPSTEDIIEAINMTASEVVFVLPNNSNIYMAAKQTEEVITDKKVVVLRSVSAPQGISAMLAFDPDADLETNKAEMKEAMKNVATASMTFAARDSVFDDKEIKQGQMLGLIENKVKYVDDTQEACIKNICTDIKDATDITVFYGSDVSEEEAEATADIIRENVSDDAEVVVVSGGQPVYFYIISAE